MMPFHSYFIIPTIYPLWCVAISFIAGIWWQSYSFCWHYTLLATLLGSVLMLPLRRLIIACNIAYIFVYAGFFIFGCFSLHRVQDNQQYFSSQTQNNYYDVECTIDDIGQTTNPHLRYTITATINTIKNNSHPSNVPPAGYTIRFYTPYNHGFQVTDTILVKNVRFRVPAGGPFRTYLLKEGITATATITAATTCFLQNRLRYSIKRWIAYYRNYLSEQFRDTMSIQTYDSFASIFLGNPLAKKKAEAMKKKLQTWGLFHYIARAGLHLVLFVSAWLFLLSLFAISWRWRQIIMIVLCSIYFLFTWQSIPFNRAFFTFLFVRVCGLMGIKTYYVPSLSFIALTNLILSPINLFSLDFQLSFGITYALAWLNEIRSRRG